MQEKRENRLTINSKFIDFKYSIIDYYSQTAV